MTMVPILLVSAASALIFGLAAYWHMRLPAQDRPIRIYERQEAHIKPEWVEALHDEELFFASKGY